MQPYKYWLEGISPPANYNEYYKLQLSGVGEGPISDKAHRIGETGDPTGVVSYGDKKYKEEDGSGKAESWNGGLFYCGEHWVSGGTLFDVGGRRGCEHSIIYGSSH